MADPLAEFDSGICPPGLRLLDLGRGRRVPAGVGASTLFEILQRESPLIGDSSCGQMRKVGMRRALATASVVALALPGCATAATEERMAYVLARPHAWIELTVVDPSIPDVPASSEEPSKLERPESCSIEVRLDGEPWMFASVFPQGGVAPYAVDSGFRFPVPIGSSLLGLIYEGCRSSADAVRAVSRQAPIDAEESLVYELRFDGDELVALPARADTVISLEDVHRAVLDARPGAR